MFTLSCQQNTIILIKCKSLIKINLISAEQNLSHCSFPIKPMKVRPSRTHYMGFSNRNPSLTSHHKNQTINILEKSFNKTKSQYSHTSSKPNSLTPLNNKLTSVTLLNHSKNNITNNLQHIPSPKAYTSQLNINTIYKEAQKGYHHQFQNKHFTKNKNIQQLYQQLSYPNLSPLNLNQQLNFQICQIKEHLQRMNKKEQINMFKVEQLKKTFLRNNEKRRNLKDYFDKFMNKTTGKIDSLGFKRLIKQYGYHINDSQINLMFQLNTLHQRGKSSITNSNSNTNNNSHNNNNSQIDLPQFINLMTKENVYFSTLKLPESLQFNAFQSYRFNPAEFEILRNKYPKLKQALKIYKNQPISKDKFQQVMKKLDITDLLIKQQNRLSIFNRFSTNNQLNVEQLLGLIATQEHQRISKQKHMRPNDHDQFLPNISANQQYIFQKHNQCDPLLELLYPVNLKKAPIIDYQKFLTQANDICNCLKQIKKNTSRNLIEQLLNNDSKIEKDQLYKRVQKLLQSEGYNFNLNQYKSFISYIDFDSANNVNAQKLEKFIFNEDEDKRMNRLDRRVRNEDRTQRVMGQQKTEDEFVNKMRVKSSGNWSTLKKTFIKEDSISELKVPTKFSAWPSRLYETDLSLVQARSSFGMGIGEHQRFNKQGKHSLGQEDKMKRLLKYESKVRRVGQWQEVNNKKLEQMHIGQEKKQRSKLYNMRLLKEQYENRCHSNSFAH